jgi:mycothiol synthase
MAHNQAIRTGDTVIHEVSFNDVSADDVKAWFTYDGLMSEEAPLVPFQLARASLNDLPEHIVVRLFVARKPDGTVIAEGRVVMTRVIDQRRSCQVHVSVHPQCRARGIATSMLSLLIDVAQREGRSTLVGWTTDRVEEGVNFARFLGAEQIEELILNRLLLSDLDHEIVREWAAASAALSGDHRLRLIDGPYPNHLMPAVFELRRGTRTTSSDDLVHELPITNIDQMRALESWWPGQRRRWSLIVQHKSSDEIAGFTELSFRGGDSHVVYQAGTIVHPNHRGRGLGKWLKTAMLDKIMAELPQVEEIRTGNAAWNHPILGMNRALGFKPWVTATAWKLDLARAREVTQSALAGFSAS